MRCKGMLFTLAAVMLGGVLFVFSIIHNQISSSYTAPPRVLTLQRAVSQNANVEYNIQKTFKRDIGATLVGHVDGLSVNGTLPVNITLYITEINQLSDFVSNMLPATTINMPSEPAVTSDSDVNCTFQARYVEFALPDGTRNITFIGDFSGNIEDPVFNCSQEEKSDAGLRMDIRVDGNPYSCDWPGRRLNISEIGVYFNVSNEIILALGDRRLRVTNHGQHRLNYSVTLTINETRITYPLQLEGAVTTEVDSSRKTGGVRLL